MWASYLPLLPSLAAAFEIAFSNHDLEEDLPNEFPHSPLPDFNWSVYPRFRCNVVNRSGLQYKPNEVSYLKDVLVRTLPNGEGPPNIIVLYQTEPGAFTNPEAQFNPSDPCASTNARTIIRFKDATEYLSRGVGNSQKYNVFVHNTPTYWKELDPNEPYPEELAHIINQLEPGRFAMFNSWRNLWDIPEPNYRGLPEQWGDIHSSGYFTDWWYLFSEHGRSMLRGSDDESDYSNADDSDADDSDASGGGGGGNQQNAVNGPVSLLSEINAINARNARENAQANAQANAQGGTSPSSDSSADEVASQITTFSTDSTDLRELVDREDYPWQPPRPQKIRNNPRWIYRPTRPVATINPAFRKWRNDRIIQAGDYRPIPTVSDDGVEDTLRGVPYDELIAEGWIVDKQAEAEYQEKREREREGIREAEIFYDLLSQEEKSGTLGQTVYDKLWEMEEPGYKPTDPLTQLLNIDTNDPEMRVEDEGDIADVAGPPGQEAPAEVQRLPRVMVFRPPVSNRVHDFLSGAGSPSDEFR
ncbi:hypothetical protein TWF481_005868 [Arthrobotrys musiformis]|uniref:Uncharacterized protein n=1 Tax=Arthrobotrys musiformis TaxID=47236 RepID=A0AAV9WEZ2_9PEZI